MKKVIAFLLCSFLGIGMVGCSASNDPKVNGYKMGVVINDTTYTLPADASDLVDAGLLFNNINFSEYTGEDYLFNGTSTTPEFLFKYKISKEDELSYKHCKITGLSNDYYGNKTSLKTPEGLGLGSSFKKIRKTYGNPTINIKNQIYIYLDDTREYCYIFETDMFYYGTISSSEIENYENLAK